MDLINANKSYAIGVGVGILVIEVANIKSSHNIELI